MRHAAIAAALLLAACNPPETTVAVTGPPRTTVPAVVPLEVGDAVPFMGRLYVTTTSPPRVTARRAQAARVAPGLPTSSPSNGPAQVRSPGVEQWRGLVAAYFPAAQVNRALAVMQCESGGNPNARGGPNSNGTYDHGLFQINSIHNLANWADPATNVAFAARLWRQSGWTPWVCAR